MRNINYHGRTLRDMTFGFDDLAWQDTVFTIHQTEAHADDLARSNHSAVDDMSVGVNDRIPVGEATEQHVGKFTAAYRSYLRDLVRLGSRLLPKLPLNPEGELS